ncbi:MAG: PAS domain-containing sensor histidine kinase [Rhodospirillales bacterium]|nr:PAS domain-containing sensor histidine kinase [Rhodospirillales bacterium]
MTASAAAVPEGTRRTWNRLRRWAARVGLHRKLAFALTLAAVISGVATVLSWTGSPQSGPQPASVLYLLVLDGVLLLILGVVVARQLVRVWAERRRGLAGSGLHVRIVLMFSLVAVTPAILVAVFSALFLDFGIQSWFSERVRTAVEASDAVAKAYLEEHRNGIRAEAIAMATDLDQQASALMRSPQMFDRELTAQAYLRSLPEALVVDGNAQVLARTPLSLTLELDLVPAAAIEQAARGDIVVLSNAGDNRVRAVVKLRRFLDAYLIVGRFIEPEVLENIERTTLAVAQYERLKERRQGILITFVLIFIIVALLLLLAAVWTGFVLATQISKPISRLFVAAERVRKGDLTARVDIVESIEEIDSLSRAFNRMTSQLEGQRESLIVANRQLDERRRFTETVLSGVSAGVVGLDIEGNIHLPNRSASELLETPLDAAMGLPVKEVVPEMADLVDNALGRRTDRPWEAEIRMVRNAVPRTLFARITAERVRGEIVGYVLTFDDISALVAAQRKAAWADVARRIAHEIKNPLTPIQLAAERLQRKYQNQIETDRETFAGCTETIVRRVEDIRKMVDEFSAFARMPRPDFRPENLCHLVREAVFLERNRSPDIRFSMALPDKRVELRCDSRQIGQALTNIVKNAAEAIAERSRDSAAEPGHIRVSVTETVSSTVGRTVEVIVEDNGKGLPVDQRDRLTEPYVTTRAGGTGLGLAIVKKIMEDHGADLLLEDRKGGGARVRIVFGPSASETGLEHSAGGDESEGDPRDYAAEGHRGQWSVGGAVGATDG